MKRIALLLSFVLVLGCSFSAFAEEEEPWYEKVHVGGLIDARILAYDKYIPENDKIDDVKTSDIFLRWLRLGVDAEPTEFISGRFAILYNQTPVSPVFTNQAIQDELLVEEGYLKFSLFWLYFQLGKYYLPFQEYRPITVSDSLVYTLGVINQTAYEVGLDSDYFALSFTGFNGASDLQGMSEEIDDFVARLELRPLAWLPNYDIAIGGSFLNDSTEMGYGVRNLFLEDTGGAPSNYEDNVGAWTAFTKGDFVFGPKVGLTFLYEMVSTLQYDEDNYLNADGDKSNISAINGELAFVLFKSIWFGGKYDRIFGVDYLGTERNETADEDEYQPLTYNRYGGFLGFGNKNKVATVIEYLHGTDNEDHKTDTITLQFLVNF